MFLLEAQSLTTVEVVGSVIVVVAFFIMMAVISIWGK